MTQSTNTFDTYDSIGNREDLSNEIYMLDVDETPFMSSIGKGKATAKYHEWQTDTLGTASANAQIEGDDTAAAEPTPTVRVGNRCQISKKVITISGTQEAIEKAGRKSEMAYQKAKQLRQLKMDMEKALTGVQVAVTGSNSVAAQLAGAESWLTTNDSRTGTEATLTSGVPTAAPVDGTQRAFTEDLLKDVLQQCYLSGGNPDMLMVGAFNKRVASSFAGNSTPTIDAKDKKRVAAVDFYVSDFGTLKIVANRHSRSRSALAIDSEMFAVAYLRPTFYEDLGKTGDAVKGHIIVEYTLESRNQASSGVIADLTTA